MKGKAPREAPYKMPKALLSRLALWESWRLYNLCRLRGPAIPNS